MSNLQVLLFVLFFVVAIVGGNGVFLLHYRRVGKSPKFFFNLTDFPLLRFNAAEWLLLLGVTVVALGIGILAVLSG
jgi:uncharacterized membrane protein